jgi:hypothetical protein
VLTQGLCTAAKAEVCFGQFSKVGRRVEMGLLGGKMAMICLMEIIMMMGADKEGRELR